MGEVHHLCPGCFAVLNLSAIRRQAGWHQSKRVIAKRHHSEHERYGAFRSFSQGLV